MRNHFIDYTTLVGIESLFHPGHRDPWASQLAGEFADLFIYGDTVGYPFAVASHTSKPKEPAILQGLRRRDSEAFREVMYTTEEPFCLRNEYLRGCFEQFSGWALSNKYTLHRWINNHNEDWIKTICKSHIKNKYVFDLEELNKTPDLDILSKKLDLDKFDVCYAFDAILKYPIYGALASKDVPYLNHPIRDAFLPPTMQPEFGEPPKVAVSFKESIKGIVENLSQDEYTVLLHELRGTVRDYGLHKMRPGEFDTEVIREVAAKTALPPRIKAVGKIFLFSSGIVGGLSALPEFGAPAAVIGALVSVSSGLWEGRLPRSIARVKWLRWALRWDIEEQAVKRE